jgi:heat shock protein HtpX
MSTTPQTFRDLIAENKRDSAMLVATFCLFVTAVGLVLILGIMAYIAPDAFHHLNWQQAVGIGAFAALVSFVLALLAYYSGDDMILAVSGARPIQHDDDPELFNVVEEMSIAAGIPMPKVYVIHDPAPNAFATGRDPEHASITVTSGLRSKLTRDELQGVVAHEMSHIQNYDIRLMLLMAVLAGTVVMLCDVFWQMLRWGPSGSRRRSSDGKDSGGGLIVIVILVIAIILAIIAPILAHLIQLAVSRRREYLADATAVQLTRYPQGLANALRKIDSDPDELQTANRGTAHLYIVNPIKKFQGLADTMFASHPPIKDRILRLEALSRQGPDAPRRARPQQPAS